MGSTNSPENAPGLPDAGVDNNRAPLVGRRPVVGAIGGLLASIGVLKGLEYLVGSPKVASGKENQQSEFKILSQSAAPYEFEYQGIPHRYDIQQLSSGMPPNDGDRNVATIYDTNKTTGELLNEIQPYCTLYPETMRGMGVRVVLGATLVDTSNGRGYFMTLVSDRDGYLHLRSESIKDIAQPNNFQERELWAQGLSDRAITWGGKVVPEFNLKQDAAGKYLETKVQYVPQPSTQDDIETYRLRLDNNGQKVGTWSKVAESTPTPSPTVTPTITPTPAPENKMSRRAFLPIGPRNISQ